MPFAFLPVGLLKTLEVGPVFILISTLSFPVSSSLPLRKLSHCVGAPGLTLSGRGVLGTDMLLKYFHALFLECSPQRVDWGCSNAMLRRIWKRLLYPAPSQSGWLSFRGRLVDELASVKKARCWHQSRQYRGRLIHHTDKSLVLWSILVVKSEQQVPYRLVTGRDQKGPR